MKISKKKKNPMDGYDIESLKELQKHVRGSSIGNPLEPIGVYDSFCVWLGEREVTKIKNTGELGYDLWFDGQPVAFNQSMVDAVSYLTGFESAQQ